MKFCSNSNGLMKPIKDETSKLICISCNNVEDGEITSTTNIKKESEKGNGVIEDKDIFADQKNNVSEHLFFGCSEINQRFPTS